MKNILLKIEKILLFVFLLLIPTQLGRHFWPEWSYVMGIRVDYLSPIFYLIDFVWIGLFLVSSRGVKRRGDPERDCFSLLAMTHKYKKIFFLVLLVVINIFVAKNHWVAGYKWLRLGQFVWTVWYLKENRKILKKFLIYTIPFWIILESFLGFGQVIKGGSLNGFFYWLGERWFNFNTIGIAQMAVSGRGFIRAYGTFSHPNSLAGFLLVSLMIWKQISDIRYQISGKILNLLVLIIGILGIVLTGSRTVIILGILYLVFIMKPSVLRTSPLKRAIFIFSCLILLFFIFYFLFKNGIVGGWDELGLKKRMDLNVVAVEMIRQSPLFGVGLGNFLVELPKYQSAKLWLQPVHNIILLILSEVGIIGIVIIIKLLKSLRFLKSTYWIWIIILITGMADHYWLTLPQNIWLLVIVLALAIK